MIQTETVLQKVQVVYQAVSPKAKCLTSPKQCPRVLWCPLQQRRPWQSRALCDPSTAVRGVTRAEAGGPINVPLCSLSALSCWVLPSLIPAVTNMPSGHLQVLPIISGRPHNRKTIETEEAWHCHLSRNLSVLQTITTPSTGLSKATSRANPVFTMCPYVECSSQPDLLQTAS